MGLEYLVESCGRQFKGGGRVRREEPPAERAMGSLGLQAALVQQVGSSVTIISKVFPVRPRAAVLWLLSALFEPDHSITQPGSSLQTAPEESEVFTPFVVVGGAEVLQGSRKAFALLGVLLIGDPLVAPVTMIKGKAGPRRGGKVSSSFSWPLWVHLLSERRGMK